MPTPHQLSPRSTAVDRDNSSTGAIHDRSTVTNELPRLTIRSRVSFCLAGVLAAVLLLGGAGVVPGAGAQAGSVSAPSATVAVTPFRLLDTRTGVGTGGATSPLGAGQTITLQVAGVGTIPADATGAVLNITATEGSQPSFITAWPTGQDRPDASILNINPGQNLPNMITVALGTGGRIDLYNYAGTTHLIADAAGYLTATGTGGLPGPQGPQGPQGQIGPSGPAGTATAWGSVDGSAATPSFSSKSPNVDTVSRVGPTGDYCITFSEAIPVERRQAATIGSAALLPPSIVTNNTSVTGDSSHCPNGLWVATLADMATLRDGDFTFMVP